MKNENGNVLFLILIAVALFAALSYAVTQSTRSGGGDASREKITTESATILQQSLGIRTAAIRLVHSQGVAAENLLFDPPANFSGMTPGEIARAVFHPQGGGAIYQENQIVTSGIEITGIGQTNIGNPLASSDIVAIRSVPKDVCLEINRRLGISIAEVNMDANIDLITTNLDDNMDRAHPGINGGGNGFWGAIGSSGGMAALAPYDSSAQGCFYNGPSDVYLYYDVIVAR